MVASSGAKRIADDGSRTRLPLDDGPFENQLRTMSTESGLGYEPPCDCMGLILSHLERKGLSLSGVEISTDLRPR
jgi:hypothetical protein